MHVGISNLRLTLFREAFVLLPGLALVGDNESQQVIAPQREHHPDLAWLSGAVYALWRREEILELYSQGRFGDRVAQTIGIPSS